MTSNNITTSPEACNAYFTSCICKDVGETCISDFGDVFYVWLAISAACHLYMCRLCVVFLFDMNAKRKKVRLLSTLRYTSYVILTR